MRRFDRSIKVLQDEVFRIVGKVATNAADNGHNPMYATKVNLVKNIREAITILSNHERNKLV